MIDTRFVLDKSDCVDGGEGCKAAMKASDNGAFAYYESNAVLVAALKRIVDLIHPKDINHAGGECTGCVALRALKAAGKEVD